MFSQRRAALGHLLASLPQGTRVIGSTDREIAGVAIDSRDVAAETLFVALRGQSTDGHRYVAQAVERGATAVVMEENVTVPDGVTAIIVPDSTRALSKIASAFYGNPSVNLAMVGVTGTNGKTTTTQMIASMLNAADMACGVIGTIGARFDEREWPLENTTPLALELHRLLAEMRDSGAKAVAMEVSSHALALNRVSDIQFRVGGLTNITRDHLDFHESFEAYAQAKRKLFDVASKAVLNLDDPHGERWAAEPRLRDRVTTYGLAPSATVRGENVDIASGGSTFDVDGSAFRVAIPGRFNVYNALCAIGVTRALGIKDAQASKGFAELRNVPGRMEHFSAGGVDAIVDYAHTPDALENVLRTVRETTRGRLIVVFGCGGDRDRGKRPQMGAVAGKLADYTFVTSDNPRTEDPQAIIDQILPGLGNAPHEAITDRAAAIERAVESARAGDVVVVAGKGHETYQIVGTATLAFDDRECVRAALGARSAA
ncbi:MAG: UDP-N-acetylmuramoyl-L-alanyl-D-glutamate--2,6-diaminopimelate ligase [Candidatus Eremiobacteraeota bacterium]|nr:UDP-N-acetylmuramoyl-L-alanyl-D-glutamate--2,6-diaminopimelate ligase [Candidatus Eremiobacteraeota bacterium]